MNGVKFNDVYVYEQEVFDNCYSLTNIKINNDNKYYLKHFAYTHLYRSLKSHKQNKLPYKRFE